MAADKRRVDLTRGPVLQRLIALAWPLFVGNILTTFYNLADMYWVSWVGTYAVAAVAITFPTVWLTFSLGMGATIAGVAFVAQYSGSNRTDEAANTAGQVILLATLVALMLGGAGIVFRIPIASMMGAEGPVLRLAADYLLIVMAGLPFKYIYFAFRSVAQGTGDSKTPRNLLIGTVLLNVVLDPFLVLGLAGLPAMGVVGAAWATFISEAVGAAISLYMLSSGRLVGVRLRLQHLIPEFTVLKRIAQVGIPASLDMGARGLSSVVVAAIVARFGAVEAAAYGIVNRLMSVVWTSAGAMEQATSSGVGQNLGAKQPERAERVAWSGASVMFGFLTVIGIILFIFPKTIVSFFRVDSDVMDTAVIFLRLSVLSYGFWGARDVLQGGFRGAGKTLPPAIITFGHLWVVQIPLTLWASYSLGYGANGYWIVLTINNVLFALVAAVWFRFGNWQQSLIEQNHEHEAQNELTEPLG